MDNGIFAIILAAGKGTRMQYDLPKVLFPVNNKPMVHTIIESVQKTICSFCFLVVGFQKEEVIQSTKAFEELGYIDQDQQLGTGHAVMVGKDQILERPENHVLVVPGDCPFIDEIVLTELITHHNKTKAAATILTTDLKEPGSYGRVIRDEKGSFVKIVESKDCNANQLKVTEINSGIYCFEKNVLFNSLRKLNNSNKQNEYYLTDVFELMHIASAQVEILKIEDDIKVRGINSKEELKIINKNHSR